MLRLDEQQRGRTRLEQQRAEGADAGSDLEHAPWRSRAEHREHPVAQTMCVRKATERPKILVRLSQLAPSNLRGATLDFAESATPAAKASATASSATAFAPPGEGTRVITNLT